MLPICDAPKFYNVFTGKAIFIISLSWMSIISSFKGSSSDMIHSWNRKWYSGFHISCSEIHIKSIQHLLKLHWYHINCIGNWAKFTFSILFIYSGIFTLPVANFSCAITMFVLLQGKYSVHLLEKNVCQVSLNLLEDSNSNEVSALMKKAFNSTWKSNMFCKTHAWDSHLTYFCMV